VIKRGELMAQAKNGAMAVVIGLEPEILYNVIAQHDLTTLDVANYNSPLQTVISGSATDIERAKPIFNQAGARRYVRLPVSAAFHSRYMAEAASIFGGYLDSFTFNALTIPVISNVTGCPYPLDDSAAIKALLVEQISKPVLWTQSIRYLLDKNMSEYNEMGPGKTLTKLVAQIKEHHQRTCEVS
jgi:malonyl CoA-acyl carrier protein transacylase